MLMTTKRRRSTTNRRRSSTKRRLRSSLVSLFPSPTLVDLLSVFFLHPTRRFYQRDLVDRTGGILKQVQRGLKRIEKAGLVSKTREGNRVYYEAQRAHPAFEDLRKVFLKTVALADVLRDRLMPLSPKIQAAFIYGSLAKGEESSGSDIDLFVIGDATAREVTAALSGDGTDLGRELNPSVYSLKEFKAKNQTGQHFIRNVMESPKIWLISDEREFEALLS